MTLLCPPNTPYNTTPILYILYMTKYITTTIHNKYNLSQINIKPNPPKNQHKNYKQKNTKQTKPTTPKTSEKDSFNR